MEEAEAVAEVLSEAVGAAEVVEAVAEKPKGPVIVKPPKAPKPPKAAAKGEEKKAKAVKIPKTIPSYWRSKDKNPELFVFTADGNLGTLVGSEGAPVKLFDLPVYGPISLEEIDRLWATRESNFEEIYQSIEAARDQLRQALAAYKTGAGTAREVVIANQLVADEEAKLITNRSAKRWIDIIPNPSTNYIDINDKYEERKIGFDVYQLKQFALDPSTLLRVLSPEEASGFSAAKGGSLSVYGVITDETLLGLHWPADIRVDNTKYFTAFQAILGETARKGGNQELFQSILGTRSSRTLRSLTKDYTENDFTPEIMETVIRALSKEYPEFRDLLLKTEDEHLVYANIMDPIFSIGLEATDPNLQNVKFWRGENLWGKALEEARTRFREENVTKKSEDIGISENDLMEVENTVISKEEQDAAKKAAIINARRFHKSH